MEPPLILVVYTDFEKLPQLFVFQYFGDSLILQADGCVINRNHDEYSEDVFEWVCDLSASTESEERFDVSRHLHLIRAVITVGFQP